MGAVDSHRFRFALHHDWRQSIKGHVRLCRMYEHIIRNERELHAIRQRIRNNPLRWALDRNNPANWARQPPPNMAEDYLRDAGIL